MTIHPGGQCVVSVVVNGSTDRKNGKLGGLRLTGMGKRLFKPQKNSFKNIEISLAYGHIFHI